MMKLPYGLLLLPALILLSAKANAQPLPRYCPETIKLHTARDIYLAGDTVWFSAHYTYTGKQALSHILYVGLYNAEKKLAQTKLRIRHGQASGGLAIPKDFQTGNFILRAYTHFQQNYPPAHIHKKLVTLINPRRPFPETAFRDTAQVLTAYDARGRYIYCYVPPKINENLTSAQMHYGETMHETPKQASGLYPFPARHNGSPAQAFAWQYANGGTQRLAVNARPPNLRVQWQEQRDALQVSSPGGEHVQLKIFTENFKLQTETVFAGQWQTRTADWPAGVYYVVEFRAGQAFSAVAAYIPQKGQAGLQIAASQTHLPLRGTQHLHLALPKSADAYSLSVRTTRTSYPEDYLPAHLFYAHSLLRSYSARYAITDTLLHKQVQAALAFQRKAYNTPGFLANFHPPQQQGRYFLPDVRDIGLHGIARDAQSHAAVKNADILVSVVQANPQIHHTKTGPDGTFSISLNRLQGKQHVFATFAEPRPGKEITFLSDYRKKLDFPKLLPAWVSPGDSSWVAGLFKNQQIRKQYGTPERTDTLQTQYQAIGLEGMADNKICMKDYILLPNLSEVFHEIVPYVSINKTGEKRTFELYNENTRIRYAPLMLLDYLPVHDNEKLLRVQPTDISCIDVIKNAFYLGEYEVPGLVHIHTKTNNFAGYDVNNQSAYVLYEGAIPATRPAPGPARSPFLPDYRELLFWHPRLGSGQQKLDIRVGDYPAGFSARVWVLAPNGKWLSQQTHFSTGSK